MNNDLDDTHNLSKIQISLDPPTPLGQVVFEIRAERLDRVSSFRSEFNLHKLTDIELRQLALFLERHRDDLTDQYEETWNATWLLGLSIQQGDPQLSPLEQQRKRRQLLLADVPINEILARVPGVSPFLFRISEQARQWLWEEHQINIESLEYASVQLYEGLDQFVDKTAPGFFVRATTYTLLLMEHHQKVKAAGLWLGGQIGEDLVEDAEEAIRHLLAKQAEASPLNE